MSFARVVSLLALVCALALTLGKVAGFVVLVVCTQVANATWANWTSPTDGHPAALAWLGSVSGHRNGSHQSGRAGEATRLFLGR